MVNSVSNKQKRLAMTKKYHLTLTVFLVLLLSACAKAVQKNAEGMINPGDEINGMVFTTTDEIDWDLSLAFSVILNQ